MQNKILVVDDEPFNREIMQELLDDQYELGFAESGQQCLDMVRQFVPDVILLDVNMPGMSGYEVCKQIKSSQETADVPVTFVSALDSLQERMSGYEAGGDDYITKPFESSELLTKIKLALKGRAARKQLKENADMAMSTAMTAMTSTGELGVVIQFMRGSFACHEYEAVANLAIESLANYGYRATVQLRIGNEVMNFTESGAVNALEATVIYRVCQEARIVDIGPRAIFNYEHISILVKGMDADNAEKIGRAKDNIALLVEGAEERIKAILAEKLLHNKQLGLVRMVENTRDTLNNVNAKYETNKIQSIKILADLIQSVEASFCFMGLSESQEESLLKMVNTAVTATIQLYQEGIELDASLADIIGGLQDLADGNVGL